MTLRRIVTAASAALAAFLGGAADRVVEAPPPRPESLPAATFRGTSGDCGRPLAGGDEGRWRRIDAVAPKAPERHDLWAGAVTGASLRAAARGRALVRSVVLTYEHPHTMWRRGLRPRLWGLS